MTNGTTIDVQYVNPPKPGKKRGTVKTKTGELFGVFPDKLGLFRPGRTYWVQFSEREYQGQTYRTITQCEPKDAAMVDASTPSPSIVPAKPDTPSATDVIWRTVAAGIQSQQVEFRPNEIIKAANMIQSAYREWLRQNQ